MNKKNANHSTGNVAHGGLVQRLDNLYNNYTIEMLLKSAEDGDAIAQYTLGKRYSNGEDVSQSDEEAAKWFRMSAEQGHDEAAEELRRLESNGSSEKTSKQPSRSGCSVMLVISVLFLLSLFLSL